MRLLDKHILDIDSRDRDPDVFPNPNDYTITLENDIYEVSNIALEAARFHNSQMTINSTNKTFKVGTTLVTLDEKNYTNGTDLAADLKLKMPAPIIDVTFDTETNALTFTGSTNFTFSWINADPQKTSPQEVLGFNGQDVSSVANSLTSGAINLDGPDAIIIRLSSGSDQFNKIVFSGTPYYTGKILTQQGTITKFAHITDSVEHNFLSGPQKIIQSLRIQFFYTSQGKLIPYDFRTNEHVLKFIVSCATDKFKNIPKIKRSVDLPPPISMPEFEHGNRWENYKVYVGIGLIVFSGIGIIYVTRKRPMPIG